MADDIAVTGKAPDSLFWRFSLALYARPGVPPACLALQDEAGVDVNVMLYLLYLAGRKRQLSIEEVRRIDDTVANWREQVVRPLRGVRRVLKGDAAPLPGPDAERLRSQVKKIELEAERIQQYALEAAFPAASSGTAEPDAGSAAAKNLAAYGILLGGFPQAAVRAILESAQAQYAADTLNP